LQQTKDVKSENCEIIDNLPSYDPTQRLMQRTIYSTTPCLRPQKKQRTENDRAPLLKQYDDALARLFHDHAGDMTRSFFILKPLANKLIVNFPKQLPTAKMGVFNITLLTRKVKI
jgi:hypothetical protein